MSTGILMFSPNLSWRFTSLTARFWGRVAPSLHWPPGCTGLMARQGTQWWHEGINTFPACPAPAEPHTWQSKAAADSCWGENGKRGAGARALCCDEAEPVPEVQWKLSLFPGRTSGPGHHRSTKGSQVLAKKHCEHCRSHNTQAGQCCKQDASYPTETFLNPLLQIRHKWSQAPSKDINPWHPREGNNRVIVSDTRAVPFCNIILPLANII